MIIPNKFNGHSPDGKRLYYKKGGSNSAEKMERERQSRILAATSVINDIFGNANREDLYSQQQNAVRDINALDVNRNYENMERQNRFGLARSGLVGGSADIDSNAELQRIQAQSLAEASAMGIDAAATLRANDERAKNSALSQAQAGIDTGTAEQIALGGLASNEEMAAGQRGAASINNAFNNFGAAYMADRIMNSMQQVNPYMAQSRNNPFSTQSTYAGQTYSGS